MLCYFCIPFSHLGWTYRFVFNIHSSVFGKCKTKSKMNRPPAEGNVNSRLHSRGGSTNKPFSCAAILDCMTNRIKENNVQHSSAIKQKCLCVYLNSF